VDAASTGCINTNANDKINIEYLILFKSDLRKW